MSILITGGAKGIGKGIALRFATQGMRLAKIAGTTAKRTGKLLSA